MKLIARPIDTWPGHLLDDADREFSRFTAVWGDTVDLLEREVRHLTPRRHEPEVVLQLALRERDLRNDGWIRADAKPDHPGVIVSFESIHGPLRYSTDLFKGTGCGGRRWIPPGWQANVRAIALGLEALRRVDRYGIARGGEQYRGWNALPPGGIEAPPVFTVEQAADFIDEHADAPDVEIDRDGWRDRLAVAYRAAARVLHPDAGGDPDLFRRLTDAKLLLEAQA